MCPDIKTHQQNPVVTAGKHRENPSPAADFTTDKVVVENNFLGDKDITTFTEKYANAKTEAEREQLLSDLKKLDADKQKQALATAIPVNEQKAELEKLKVLQASPECNTQCQGLVAYSISELEPVANNTELHKNNLSKAVLASVIVAFTLDKSSSGNGKASQGTAATGKSGSSAIDDIVKGNTGNIPSVVTKPVNIATDFTKTPQSIWGRSADDIVKDFQAAGYQVNVRQSTRGSGQAVIIEVKGHPEISQIQYHPGGGRHGGSYYKVSTTTQGTMKVVDPGTYKPTQGEKATIINKPRE